MSLEVTKFAVSWASTYSLYDVLIANSFMQDWALQHRPVISRGTESHWLYAGHNYLEPDGLPVICQLNHERMYLRKDVQKRHVDVRCLRGDCGATCEIKRFETEKTTVLGRRQLVKVMFDPKLRFPDVTWKPGASGKAVVIRNPAMSLSTTQMSQRNALDAASTSSTSATLAQQWETKPSTFSLLPADVPSIVVDSPPALDNVRPKTFDLPPIHADKPSSATGPVQQAGQRSIQPIKKFDLPPIHADMSSSTTGLVQPAGQRKIRPIKFELPPIHADKPPQPAQLAGQSNPHTTTHRQPPIQLHLDVSQPPPPPDSPSPSPSPTHAPAPVPNPTRFTIKLPPRAGRRKTAKPAPALTPQRSYSSQEESGRPTRSLPVTGQKRRNEESESESSTSQLSQSSKGPKRQDTGHARR